MAFCKNCGNQLGEGATFCSKCGTKVDAQQAAPQAQPVQATVMGDADVNANKGMSVLAYLGILLLIPLFARKNSEYCRFHLRQGIPLAVVCFAYVIVTQILLAIIGAIFPGRFYFYVYVPSTIYTIFNFIFLLGNIGILVLVIIGIVNAATGKKKELAIINKIPFVGKLADIILNAVK